MKYNILVLAFFIIFQPIFGGKILALKNSPGEKVILIQKEQNGKEITAKAGEIIQIELSELGSAGYSWQIDYLESQYLEPISEDTKRGLEKGKVGVPVLHVWRFKAVKPGQTEIKMNYYRKWEGVGKSTDHFNIKFKIIKDGR